jgi:hypothetical protein
VDRIQRNAFPLSVLLLNRGGKFYRTELLTELQSTGLGEVICIEGPHVPYDIEPLSRQFPDIRFLLFQQEASVGEKLNLAMEEARSRFVMVAWSDMKVASSISTGLIEQVEKSDLMCTVPQLRAQKGGPIPSVLVPAWIKGRKLELIPWVPDKEGMRSIFPFDFCGIYNKLKFQLHGGFDRAIRNPYWQKLDFGFRVFLWGETILANPAFQMHYLTDTPSEDSTPDEGYKLFYLKNLAVLLKADRGVLPYTRFLQYMARSDTGPLYSFKEFREVRKWVERHQYRFKRDAAQLLSQWNVPE